MENGEGDKHFGIVRGEVGWGGWGGGGSRKADKRSCHSDRSLILRRLTHGACYMNIYRRVTKTGQH